MRWKILVWCGVLASVACDRPRDVSVRVSARDTQGHEVQCGKGVAVAEGVSMRLKKLRFYVHDVAFRRQRDGQWIAPAQPKGLDFVGEGVWLVDLDDARCDPEYSPEVHRYLPMSLPRARYDAMRFTLGVPEALNHKDPLDAAPHLALTSMHWGWQAGYRFLRLDGEVDGATFAAHIGSTGCVGEVGASISCARPNRAKFVIERDWFAGSDEGILELDLAALLDGVMWSEAKGCMGNAGQGDCDAILKNLGLDPETGLDVKTEPSRAVFSSPDGGV